MSEDEQTYCRLCAEPTPRTRLISPVEDMGINSKILAVMQWINIDISSSNILPSTVCFACFDSLERTWMFLQNVRTAQVKLNKIFAITLGDQIDEKLDLDLTDAGKSLNNEWEHFQGTKVEIKSETDNYDITVEGSAEVIDADLLVKTESPSFEENHSDGFNSSDSDLPLLMEKTKARKLKKLKRKDYEAPLITLTTATWDNYMCRCANCDAQCKNIMSLRLHSLQIHSCCCTFKCSDCGKVIQNFKAFVNHVRLHKKLLRFCCEFCNKCFKMTTCLKKHRNKVHSDIYRTMCQNCGATFDNPELLQDHLTLFTKNYKKRTLKTKLDNELKCNLCNKEFKSRSNLHQHKLVHTERTRDFSCHVCGKMFFTKGTLSTHMMIHDDSKPYKCGFCPMAFRARGNLQAHISLHSGVKPFVCEQCGKSFRVKRHLKSHSIVHTDLMPYICDYCNKSFRFKTRLNLHLRQHTGAKPYNCVLCQRDFTNGSNFKKHMKRRHDIDTSKRKYQNVVIANAEQGPADETVAS